MNNQTIYKLMSNYRRVTILNKINTKLEKSIDQNFKFIGHLLEEETAFHDARKLALYNCYEYANKLKTEYKRAFARTYAYSLLYSGVPTYDIRLSDGSRLQMKNKIHRIIGEI